MAKLYGELRASITRSESKPKVKLTEQTWTEGVIIFPSTFEGVPRWCCILTPMHTLADLKSRLKQTPICLNQIGQVVHYRDGEDRLLPMSGWGRNPPKAIKTWLNTHYTYPNVDGNIDITYGNDDIRLCTMQRSTLDQRLGLSWFYYRHDSFYYMRLYPDCTSSLAYRAGLRNFDRIISINGVNIEQDTPKQLAGRFKVQRHLPVQILVCSPATYAHYKLNDMSLHVNLSTVQYLRPVFDISEPSVDIDRRVIVISDENFCAVQWGEKKTICTVPQSAVFKRPELTHINDICFVEIEEQYRKGRIIFTGSYNDCKRWDTGSNLNPDFTNSDDIAIAENTTNDSQYIDERVYTIVEQLPNELFFYLFNFIDASNLYGAFWGLNSRLNNLLQSYWNLSLIFDEKTDSSMMKLYASQLIGLTIDTSNMCDMNQFSNLHGLALYNRHSDHLVQIQPKIIPNLTHLSFFLESDFKAPSQVINYVFSGQFSLLRHVNLGRIDTPVYGSWSRSPSLQFVSIYSDQPINIVSAILTSCSNLHHLQLHVLPGSSIVLLKSPLPNHPLQRFTLWSHCAVLTLDIVNTLLTYTPNVQHLYLQTICRTSFVHLADGVVDRLHHLSRFDCYVTEMMNSADRIGNLAIVHQLHPCLNRTQCIVENDKVRIFATK